MFEEERVIRLSNCITVSTSVFFLVMKQAQNANG